MSQQIQSPDPQVLFLHTNYPAQFRFLVKAYIARGWKVWFASHTQKNKPLPKVKYIQLEKSPQKGSKLDQNQRSCLLAFKKLLSLKRNDGLNPKRIYVHAGWGLGSFLRELFPNSVIIAYSEWWFTLFSQDFLFNPLDTHVQHDLDSRLLSLLRNHSFSYELQQADLLIAPTEWQRSQLPKNFRKKCHVVFDGIDPVMFSPGLQTTHADKRIATLSPETPLLTYATRGLEPYRGFPEFVKASFELLKEYKHWHVAIAGNDSINYYKSSRAPKNGYGKEAYEFYKSHNLLSRVHFLGSLPLLAYRDLLRRSNLHCYFTRPYVLSWSFLESMFTGCRLFASNTPPVLEFAKKDPDTYLVDYIQSDVGSSLVGHIAQIEQDGPIKDNNTLSDYRKSLRNKLSAETCVQKHLELADSRK
tara:strand:- start:5301 stop:6545 length:1245 start_codon:yes stop_codon:yes gene_type:complete